MTDVPIERRLEMERLRYELARERTLHERERNGWFDAEGTLRERWRETTEQRDRLRDLVYLLYRSLHDGPIEDVPWLAPRSRDLLRDVLEEISGTEGPERFLELEATGDNQREFHGHRPHECGEHRTVGPHRAWCTTCKEWCYPNLPCKGCELAKTKIERDHWQVRAEEAEEIASELRAREAEHG